MSINELINAIKAHSKCEILSPVGQPLLPNGLILPPDLEQFYNATGGVRLFKGMDYAIDIVSPSELIRSNSVIIEDECFDDISHNWFIIGKADEQYISIDLATERLGRCYDSFWDRHGVVGDCAVVALSFTDLLERLWNEKGRYWYWLSSSFSSLGDAYD